MRRKPLKDANQSDRYFDETHDPNCELDLRDFGNACNFARRLRNFSDRASPHAQFVCKTARLVTAARQVGTQPADRQTPGAKRGPRTLAARRPRERDWG